ncbi:uncharacterized protein LOC110727135 [Chenopodium quinoa]|uniref:uncharacterized protein LOC110727115 n=1 Tax=Chenopodium quinoa TaxID=63459 RepID=UPI000B774007|nr:uncharacterized protein LOC110727115 [Chenopodium quinoa]XP_021762370.1 uncharacterized protein LOC110727135 [Chenopodium quinoa]
MTRLFLDSFESQAVEYEGRWLRTWANTVRPVPILFYTRSLGGPPQKSRHFSLPHLLISSSTVNNHKTAHRVTATISEAPTFQNSISANSSGSSFASVSNSVLLNEALHCLGQKCIHKFDLVAETFEKVPLLIKPDLPKPHQIKLGVIGEKNCLCAMLVHHSEEEKWMFESWMLEEYNKWDSWKKLYRIDLKKEIARNYIGFLGFTYNGNFCIREKNGLKLIDPCDPPSCVMVCRGSVFVAIDYVESLVSPFSLD